MSTLLESLTAGLDAADLERLAARADQEIHDDAFALQADRLRGELEARGADALVLALAVASARHRLRTRGVLSGWSLLADLLGADADCVEEVLARMAREPAEQST